MRLLSHWASSIRALCSDDSQYPRSEVLEIIAAQWSFDEAGTQGIEHCPGCGATALLARNWQRVSSPGISVLRCLISLTSESDKPQQSIFRCVAQFKLMIFL